MRELLGGSGGIVPPRKLSDLKALKGHFQNSQADSCVKKVPKIDRYLSLTLIERALSSAVLYFHNFK